MQLSNWRTLVAATAVTVTVVAWGVLVFAAIDFGRDARDGSNADWLYLVLATLGAVACMFGAIVMAARLQAMMRVAQSSSAGSSTRPLAQPLEPLPPVSGSGSAPSTVDPAWVGEPYQSTTGRPAPEPAPAPTPAPAPAPTAAPEPAVARGTGSRIAGPGYKPSQPAGQTTPKTQAGKRALRR